MGLTRWLVTLIFLSACATSCRAQCLFGPNPANLAALAGPGASFYYWRSSPGWVPGWGGVPVRGSVFMSTASLAPLARTAYYYAGPISVAPPVVFLPAVPRYSPDEMDLLLNLGIYPAWQRQALGEFANPGPGIGLGAEAGGFRPILPNDRRRAGGDALAPVPGRNANKPQAPKPRPPQAAALPLARPQQPRDEFTMFVKQGLEAFAQEEYGKAERRFQQAAVFRPQEARGHFFLAQARIAQGKYQEAVAAMQSGLRFQPAWPTANFRPRKLYGQQSPDWFAHSDRLQHALRSYPDDAVLLFLSAYQLWFDGRQDEARALFRRARALAPDPYYCDCFLNQTVTLPILIW